MTIDDRQEITAWWLYHKTESKDFESPEHIRTVLEYVEDNLPECDRKLAAMYREYIPIL